MGKRGKAGHTPLPGKGLCPLHSRLAGLAFKL